jgi:hypothetical protein
MGQVGAKLLVERGEIDIFQLGKLDHGLEPIDVVLLDRVFVLHQFLVFFGRKVAPFAPIAKVIEALPIGHGLLLDNLHQLGFIRFLMKLFEEVEGDRQFSGGQLLD